MTLKTLDILIMELKDALPEPGLSYSRPQNHLPVLKFRQCTLGGHYFQQRLEHANRHRKMLDHIPNLEKTESSYHSNLL